MFCVQSLESQEVAGQLLVCPTLIRRPTVVAMTSWTRTSQDPLFQAAMQLPSEVLQQPPMPSEFLRRSDRQLWLRADRWNRRSEWRTQREVSEQSAGSGVKRHARAAELPDEDEQEGKFQQVEGLTTVDAEEIGCEFSVEDDFLIYENAEGVDEEIVKAIVAGKKKELDAMEAFGIKDVCEELPKDAKVITTRWCNVPKSDKWRCRFVAREFGHDDPEMEGLCASDSTSATSRLDVHAVQHGYSTYASMQRTRTSTLRKTRKCTVGLRKNGSSGIMQEVVELRILGGRSTSLSWQREMVSALSNVLSSHHSADDQEQRSSSSATKTTSMNWHGSKRIWVQGSS